MELHGQDDDDGEAAIMALKASKQAAREADEAEQRRITAEINFRLKQLHVR